MDILCLEEVPVTRERSHQPVTTCSLPDTHILIGVRAEDLSKARNLLHWWKQRESLCDTTRLMPTRGITPFALAHPPPSPSGDTLRGGEGGWLRWSDAPGGHQACGSLRKVSGREVTTCATSLRTTATIGPRRLSWFTHTVYAGIHFSLLSSCHLGVLEMNDGLWLLRSFLTERDHQAMISPVLDCPRHHRASNRQARSHNFAHRMVPPVAEIIPARL